MSGEAINQSTGQPINSGETAYYSKLIRESSAPLESIPAELPAEWKALIPKKDTPVFKGIRAVLFDLYGTLFISAAGEISSGVPQTPAPPSSPRPPREESGVDFSLNPAESIPAAMKDYFRQAVFYYHEKAKAEGNPWPEVRTEKIWADYKGIIPENWESPRKMRQLQDKIGLRASRNSIGRELALRYELALNPVFPMPHAEQALRSLAKGGLKLGVISNAQFFSPLLFDAFFNASPEELGFDPDLLIYSFRENEAKPSPRLFAKARERLARYNIKPEETLYIGNDMKNDIISALEAGFVTALFAGDRRSLRLREDDPVCLGKKPDMVICDLQTLESVRPITDT